MRRIITFALCASALFIQMAQAQNLPSSADPTRMMQQLKPLVTPDASLEAPKKQKELAPLAPSLKVEGVSFVLNDIQVSGSTVYVADDFLPLYEALIGEKIGFKDIQEIASALTRLYHKDGYVLSKVIVPAQDVEGGVVQLRAIEGYIRDVLFEGDLPQSLSKLNDYASSIQQVRPVNFKDIERYTLLMNDLPGIHVEAVLKPSHSPQHTLEKTVSHNKKIKDALSSIGLSKSQQQNFLKETKRRIHIPKTDEYNTLKGALRDVGFSEADVERLTLKAYRMTDEGKQKERTFIPSMDSSYVGGSTLTFNVKQSENTAFASVDNLGTKYVGPILYNAGAEFNHKSEENFGRTSIRASLAHKHSEMKYLELSHTSFVGSEGEQLTFAYEGTMSEPGAELEVLEFESRADALTLQYMNPLKRSRSENANLRFAFNYRDSDVKSLGEYVSRDKLLVARAGFSYDFADVYKGVNLLDVEVSQGFDFFNSRRGESLRSRADGENNFTKFTAQASRLQKVTDEVNLLASVYGQFSNDALLASEEFGFGGSQFGRGLESSEITGDHGVNAKLELSYALPERKDHSIQVYSFYDFGAVWNKNDGSTSERHQTGATLGFGARFNIDGGTSGFIEVGKPLTRPVSSSGGEGGDDPNVFFTLRRDF